MNKILAFLVKIGWISGQELYYIGGADVLPPPLKGEDEQAALLSLEQGSEEAKQLLIERNLRLVVFISRRFENTGVNLEDLISIGIPPHSNDEPLYPTWQTIGFRHTQPTSSTY